MTTINGISAISLGLKCNPIFEQVVIPLYEPWEPIPASNIIMSGTLDFSPEAISTLFGEWERKQPNYKVRLTTRRTPRKLKKSQKKSGTYNTKRHYNFENANITTTFI